MEPTPTTTFAAGTSPWRSVEAYVSPHLVRRRRALPDAPAKALWPGTPAQVEVASCASA